MCRTTIDSGLPYGIFNARAYSRENVSLTLLVYTLILFRVAPLREGAEGRLRYCRSGCIHGVGIKLVH